MTRLLIFLLTIGVIALGTVTIISCSNADSQNGETEIPESIFSAADKTIISKTGQTFFDEYISPDFEESKTIPQGFFMSYRFYMPERPYIDERITFILDSNGVVVNNVDITGIPDCAANPDNCRFLVGEDEAVKIAADAGLEKGIKDWGKTFIWNSEFNRYVWSILSTLKGIDTPDGFRGSGTEIIIDPNSGEVLKKSEWNIR